MSVFVTTATPSYTLVGKRGRIMVAATNSVRAIPKKATAPRSMPAIPLSIAPRGNRSLMPTVSRAKRDPKNTRDYGKNIAEAAPVGFDLPGFREGE